MLERGGEVLALPQDFASKRSVTALLALSALLLLISVSAAYQAVGELNATTNQVEHTLRTEAAISRLATLNEQIETARRGQLLAPSMSFVTILQTTNRKFESELANVKLMTSDNAIQQDRLAEIHRLHAARGELISSAIITPLTAAALVRESGPDSEQGVKIARRVRALAILMGSTESDLLAARTVAQARSTTRFYMVGGLAGLLLLAFLVAVIVIVLRYNRELGEAQAGLRAANATLELAVAARTAELSRANEEIQRFAYIVSHDLRSPLVNVLGFTAELDEAGKAIRGFLGRVFEQHPALRDEAVWTAADEDLPEALDFIRKSTEKMDRLINSILELSRQGRRVLTPEHLDMNALLDTVVASLHQRAEAAGATVEVQPLPPVESDRIAVEQILSNLLENALKYLQPGRAGVVTVSGTQRGRMVDIAVTDNGRGIAAQDQERVFELFRRAGVQDQAGEGIGLANVRALAYRLGGTIGLQSVPGEGSTFTLSIPQKLNAGDPRS